jgi:hypothetical protein
MSRYSVENDSPDGGRSTFAECFGPNGSRGRVLSEHDTLESAIIAADLEKRCPDWIWDNLKKCKVSPKRIAECQSAK